LSKSFNARAPWVVAAPGRAGNGQCDQLAILPRYLAVVAPDNRVQLEEAFEFGGGELPRRFDVGLVMGVPPPWIPCVRITRTVAVLVIRPPR
jgi:hypothetical protein